MNDVQLTAEDLKTFQDFYERRLAEAAGARDDAEELAIARDILQAVVNDGLTPTPDGGASYVRRQGALDWTDPATLRAAAQVSGGSGRSRAIAGRGTQGGAKDMLMGGAMLVAALVGVTWFLWPKGARSEAELTPTTTVVAEAGQATATPLPTLEAELLADIVDAAGVKTDLVVPRTLEIKGVSFVVQPVKISAGDWPLPDDERAVSWVFGTVVNYVLGLEATPDNKALAAALQPGDELLLRMSTGPAYRFAYADAVRVAPQASEVFRQTRPGLTLALLGDEVQPTRVVIRAVYRPESELAGDSPLRGSAETAALGQTVTIAARSVFRLKVLDAAPLALPGMAPGQVYLTVDYTVENTLADQALPTAGFSHQVIDGQGQTYPPFGGVAGGAVGYPPLPAEIQAGGTVTTTAIYAVPVPVLREGLIWRFSPGPAEQTVDVALPPYSGPLEAQVAVKEASLQADGSLAATVSIQAALNDVEVTASDVQLQGGSLGAANSFPWQIPAGSSNAFSLHLDIGQGPLTLTLLGQGFEITVE